MAQVLQGLYLWIRGPQSLGALQLSSLVPAALQGSVLPLPSDS